MRALFTSGVFDRAASTAAETCEAAAGQRNDPEVPAALDQELYHQRADELRQRLAQFHQSASTCMSEEPDRVREDAAAALTLAQELLGHLWGAIASEFMGALNTLPKAAAQKGRQFVGEGLVQPGPDNN